jgi:hypothetical protein
VFYNPRADEMWQQPLGPQVQPHTSSSNGDLTRAQRNTPSGFVERTYMSAVHFDEQHATFTARGYSVNPSLGSTTAFVGDAAAIAVGGGDSISTKNAASRAVINAKKAAEKPERRKRKQESNNAEDVDAFQGPWAKPVGAAQPKAAAVVTEEIRVRQEEIAAERAARKAATVAAAVARADGSAPVAAAETSVFHGTDLYDYQVGSFFYHVTRLSILHSVFIALYSFVPRQNHYLPCLCYQIFTLLFLFTLTYQGRSYLHPPDTRSSAVRAQRPLANHYLPRLCYEILTYTRYSSHLTRGVRTCIPRTPSSVARAQRPRPARRCSALCRRNRRRNSRG